MRREFLRSFGILSLVFSATTAFAGAYGEPIEPEEIPMPPPPAPVVEAEPPIDYAANGAYLGLGGLYAIEFFGAEGGTGGDADNAGGISVVAGYRFRPHFAAEIAYENYFKFDRSFNDIEAWSLSANLKTYILTGRWQPYALFGVGHLSAGSDGNSRTPNNANHGDGAVLRLGMGMDAYITEDWSVGPEMVYDWPFGGASDLDMMTLGVGARYKF